MPRNDEAHWVELMRRSQAGDSLAYERLLTELGEAIAGYVRHRFGWIDFAEDCLQECLVSIHQARHTYVAGRPFRPWLFAVVRHRTIDMLRRQRVYSELFPVSLDDEGQVPGEVPHNGDDEQRDLAAGAVLAALEPEHREALLLTKLMGFSNAEAASRVGISTGAMKVRVHRATRAAIRVLEAEHE